MFQELFGPGKEVSFASWAPTTTITIASQIVYSNLRVVVSCRLIATLLSKDSNFPARFSDDFYVYLRPVSVASLVMLFWPNAAARAPRQFEGGEE